jgi:hypothetical protein
MNPKILKYPKSKTRRVVIPNLKHVDFHLFLKIVPQKLFVLPEMFHRS